MKLPNRGGMTLRWSPIWPRPAATAIGLSASAPDPLSLGGQLGAIDRDEADVVGTGLEEEPADLSSIESLVGRGLVAIADGPNGRVLVESCHAVTPCHGLHNASVCCACIMQVM